MNKNAEGHPLHGRDAEWIESAATGASLGIEDSYDNGTVPNKLVKGLLALAHDHGRLKSEREELLDRLQGLTRAIELSGAHPDADWKMLEAHLSVLRTEHDVAVSCSGELQERAEKAEGLARAAMETAKNQGAQRDELVQLVHDIGLEVVGPTGTYRGEKHLVPLTRQLRERAEAAEAKVTKLGAEVVSAYAKGAEIEQAMTDNNAVSIAAIEGLSDSVKLLTIERDELLAERSKPKPPSKLDELIADTRRVAVAVESIMHMKGGSMQACGHMTGRLPVPATCSICDERGLTSND